MLQCLHLAMAACMSAEAVYLGIVGELSTGNGSMHVSLHLPILAAIIPWGWQGQHLLLLLFFLLFVLFLQAHVLHTGVNTFQIAVLGQQRCSQLLKSQLQHLKLRCICLTCLQ